jgi:hypothetical protein
MEAGVSDADVEKIVYAMRKLIGVGQARHAVHLADNADLRRLDRQPIAMTPNLFLQCGRQVLAHSRDAGRRPPRSKKLAAGFDPLLTLQTAN